jgi:sugar (pentulose or hexulose) kinase
LSEADSVNASSGPEPDSDDRAWRDVLIALDIGTSGARAAAFDLNGRRRIEIRRAYPTVSGRPGWAEQDPLRWRSAGLAALRGLVVRLGPRRVAAVGLTGQCPSVVLLDRGHRPVTAGLIYRDNRAVAEATQIADRLGADTVHARTGHVPAAFHIGPKLLWLRRNDPAAWGHAAHVAQPRDWLALALTGELATDGTHAAATLAFDLRARAWAPDLAAVMDVPMEWLPPVRRSEEVVGQVTAKAARESGLAPGTPVVIGGADSQACALGGGVVSRGPVSEMAGSSTCLNAVVSDVLPNLQVTHYPHVVSDALTTETGINTTGAAIAWLADLAYGGRSGRAGAADYAAIDHEAGSAAPGADGLLALPVLGDGERTDPGQRGALVGLSLRHGRGALARAVMEGVAFAIADQLDLLRAGGAPPTELRVSGGDSRLRTWNRVKADVTGVPVRTVPGDAAVTGVAMLAGLGVGLYSSVADVIERCVRPDPPIDPDPATRAVYDDALGRYRELASSQIVHIDESEAG